VNAFTVLRRHRQRLARGVLAFYAVGLLTLICQPCAMAMGGAMQPQPMAGHAMPAHEGGGQCCPSGQGAPAGGCDDSTPCADVGQLSSDVRAPQSAPTAPVVAVSFVSALDLAPQPRLHVPIRALRVNPVRSILLTFGVFLK
jgi:hypothetical protein